MIKLNKYLIISFISGLIIMGFELTASRIIAPIIGSSLYTWTSVIGIILFGLSFGNYVGGLLIDKKQEEKLLSWFLAASGVSIAFVPTLAKLATIIIFWKISLLLRIVLISSGLFFLPSFFLGGLYPVYLRLFIKEIDNAGKKAGLLSALSSFGGISGTFLTGFIFIGFIGSSYSLYLMSLILFIASFFVTNLFKNYYFIFLLFIFISLLVLLNRIPSLDNFNPIFQKESGYYKIRVVDHILKNKLVRSMFLDFDVHSIESLDNKKIGTYQDISPLLQIFNKNLKKILVMGGGSYNIPKDLYKIYGADIIVAEIDPEVTKTAEHFFNLKSYPIKTYNDDGRLYLNTVEEKFDLIFQDSFNSFISIPWHLTTIETDTLVKNRLNPNGIYVLNIISSEKGENSLIYKGVLKTLSSVFTEYHALFLNNDPEKIQNMILIGVNSKEKLREIDDKESVSRKIADTISENNIPLTVRYQYRPGVPGKIAYFSDDLAPVEKLSLKSINAYIDSYAQWYYKK